MNEEQNTNQTDVASSADIEASLGESEYNDALAAPNEKALDEAEQRASQLSAEEKAERLLTLKPILEGALLALGEAMTLARMQSVFDEYDIPSKGLLVETLQLIQQDCQGRGFALVEVASGWRFQVRDDYAPWVNRLWQEKPQKYSRALLETLSLIAYRQPLTRGDIEEVRGVAVSSHIMKTLTEREWVKVVGSRDVPGRPALYATTRQFLDYFGLKSLDELPSLGELKDIDSLNEDLDLEPMPNTVINADDLAPKRIQYSDSDGDDVVDAEPENDLIAETETETLAADEHDEEVTDEETADENEADDTPLDTEPDAGNLEQDTEKLPSLFGSATAEITNDEPKND